MTIDNPRGGGEGYADLGEALLGGSPEDAPFMVGDVGGKNSLRKIP